ncbi:MAG: DUF6382 domain-containing protein [Acetatifactor sp.]|nr:DUF6382 domain-containing protein [Acetatifactor sp.]
MLTDIIVANKSYTKLDVAESDTLDRIALRVIKQDCPDFLLPVRIMEIDGRKEVRYELSDGVRLSYGCAELTRKEFSHLLEKMLLPFKMCGDWFLDYHNILLDADYILVGRKEDTVRYLYIPVAEYAQTEAQVKGFFEEFILRTSISDDSQYTVKLLRTLKGEDANLMTLLDMLIREKQQIQEAREGREKVAERKPVQEDAPDEGAGRTHSGEELGVQGISGNLIGKLFGEDEEADKGRKTGAGENGKKAVREKQERGGLLDRLLGKGRREGDPENRRSKVSGREEQEQRKTSEISRVAREQAEVIMEEAEDVTQIEETASVSSEGMLRLRLIESSGYRCPPLMEIDLRRGSVTVGRRGKDGQAKADYCFEAALSFISRRHLRLEREADEWVIVDLGSENGTFVNDEALAANIRYPLRRGDIIMLSRQHRIRYQVC